MRILISYFLKIKTYVYVNIMTVHISFFAISAILGVKHLNSEESSSYILVLLLSSVLSYFFLFIDLIRLKYIKKSFLFLFLIPFFVIISYLTGGYYDDFANKTVLLFFLLVLPSMFSGYIIARDYESVRLFNGYLFISILIFLGLLRSLSELFSSSVIDLLTVFGGGQYQALSYFAAFGYSTFLLYLLFFKNSRFPLLNFFIFPILIIYLTGIFLSGGRGGLMVAIFSTIVFLFLKYGIKKFSLYFFLLIIFISTLYEITIQFEFENKERVIQSVERLFSFISNEGIDMSQTSNREDFYDKSLTLIYKKPFLGYGIFGYLNFTGEFYSHNIFLDIFLHGGFFYFFIWIFFLFIFFFKLILIIRANPKEIVILVPFLSSFILLLVSGTYLQESLFWFSLAFVFTYKSKPEKILMIK